MFQVVPPNQTCLHIPKATSHIFILLIMAFSDVLLVGIHGLSFAPTLAHEFNTSTNVIQLAIIGMVLNDKMSKKNCRLTPFLVCLIVIAPHTSI